MTTGFAQTLGNSGNHQKSGKDVVINVPAGARSALEVDNVSKGLTALPCSFA